MTRVLERGPWPEHGGDYANLDCGHQVWVPPDHGEIDRCGECEAEAGGRRSAPRWVSFGPPGRT